MAREQRKLAAILVADLVGCSRFVGRDEMIGALAGSLMAAVVSRIDRKAFSIARVAWFSAGSPWRCPMMMSATSVSPMLRAHSPYRDA